MANLDDFYYSDLKPLENNRIAVFVLTTYGEGALTDKEIDFDLFIRPVKKIAKCEGLSKVTFHLQYEIFGLLPA